jgi:hypothetical protein
MNVASDGVKKGITATARVQNSHRYLRVTPNHDVVPADEG